MHEEQELIEEIKTALIAALDLADKTTGKKWVAGKTCVGIISVFEDTQTSGLAIAMLGQWRAGMDAAKHQPNAENNVRFIAAAKGMCPKTCRGLLETINRYLSGLEKYKYTNEQLWEFCYDGLSNICSQWKNS